MRKNSQGKIVCIIPARGGSKGIPNKNIIDFCGKPLLAWSIIQAKNTNFIDNVYVTSDSDEILRIAKNYGAVAVKRPDYLSGDMASSESALLHCLEGIERNCPVSLVVFLQATSPLRESKDIDNAITELQKENADSLFSMSLLDDFCIWHKNNGKLQSLSYNQQKRGRRQEREPLYLENGSIYVFKPEVLKKYYNRLGNKIAMFEMNFWKSWEIDSPQDIDLCSWYFNNKLKKEKDYEK